jgi:hypothetical protein
MNTYLTEAGGTQITNTNLKNFVIKVVGMVSGSSTDYTSPEHDLSEIKDAVNTDSYLKVAVSKYSQLITKNGYRMTSVNENALTYIKQRIRLMEFGTSIPFDSLLDTISNNLTEYSNVFLVKSRIDKIQGGLQAKGILDKKPVGGYFILDPTTMMIKRDTAGTIKGYQQTVDGTNKTFKPTDIIHIYIDKEGGNAFGTPRYAPCLDDVRILRKIEGNVLSLIYRFAIPLYQAKIGLPQQNFMATDKEIKDAQKEIEKMPSDGIIVTNERTEFKVLGAEGNAIDVKPYLDYYENRVFSGLNLSQSMMGRGGAKQDADSMEQQVHDQVKFFQHTIEAFLATGMFNELLMEGGFDPINNPDDSISFTFNEISLDTKIKMENNVITKFQGNLIPFDEARREIGLTSDNVDTSLLYANMITQANAKELLQMKMDTTTATSNDNRSTNGKTPTSTANKDAKTKNAPTNQHGTYSAKVKEHALHETYATEYNYKKNYADVYKKYRSLRNKVSECADIDISSYKSYWNDIYKSLCDIISDAAGRGMLAYSLTDGVTQQYSTATIDSIDSITKKSLQRLAESILSKLNTDASSSYRKTVMDTLEYRLRFTCEYVEKKSYWYGYLLAAKQKNVKKIYVKFNSDSDKKEHKSVIDLTNRISLQDIPPFHPYCKCSLYKERG